jgi:hypothetical protein
MARACSAAALTALAFAGACAWPSPERQLLLDFFRACQNYDITVLSRLGTADCNPQTDGVVQQFDIVSVVDASGSAEHAAREVVIDARVRPLSGPAVPRRLLVKLERVDGRWMVAALTPLPASQTAPATFSAQPN